MSIDTQLSKVASMSKDDIQIIIKGCKALKNKHLYKEESSFDVEVKNE